MNSKVLGVMVLTNFRLLSSWQKDLKGGSMMTMNASLTVTNMARRHQKDNGKSRALGFVMVAMMPLGTRRFR